MRRAELSCYDKKPEACRLAAEAYRAGAVVAADPEKARTFLKVELTYLVRGCEKRLIAACLRLAERYARGEGLPENASTAEQLLVHVKELCARAKMKAPAPECALVASR